VSLIEIRDRHLPERVRGSGRSRRSVLGTSGRSLVANWGSARGPAELAYQRHELLVIHGHRNERAPGRRQTEVAGDSVQWMWIKVWIDATLGRRKQAEVRLQNPPSLEAATAVTKLRPSASAAPA
jgi:hypothetical protein